VKYGEGAYKHDLYRIWFGMHTRCYDKHSKPYKNYGLRGILICDRWNKFKTNQAFMNFVSDMGERPSKEYSIDRIDNNDGYFPENCRWATNTQQLQNKRPRPKDIDALRRNKTWIAWAKMRNRNKANYVKRWDLYENFIADMGERPSDIHMLTRLDRNKKFSKSNCIWLSKDEMSISSYKNDFYRGMLYKLLRNFPDKIPKAWKDDLDSFKNDIGPRPSPFHKLVRIDKSRHFSKSNCKWADSERLRTMNG
jgi:hypothetical protein